MRKYVKFSFIYLGKLELLFERFVNQPTAINQSTMVGTFPSLPREFDISFDFKATSWPTGRASIVHLTMATVKDNKWGSRIPAINFI